MSDHDDEDLTMSDYDDEELSEASSVWPEMSDEAEDFKNKLHEHISAIESSGTYASSGNLSEFTNPGICLDGLDILRLPIGVEDVKHVIQRSQKAPFGKDSKTIIDVTVRKAWQIDADKIKCCNSDWQQYLDKITSEACEKLGVPDPSLVRADLYKMLVYEEGGKFEAHQDTERQKGMFATLIICLPSHHSGGDVVLEHNNQVITINTSEASMLNASYLAWYADVTHTVKEVTSGYRVALSYNLINNQPQPLQSANGMTNRTTKLTQILTSWNEELQQELGQVIVPLDHQYTNMGLSLSKLKGRDSHVVLEIMSACNGADGMLLFLGHMERHKVVPDDIVGREDSSLYLSSLFDLQGLMLEIRGERRIDKECLLHNVYQDRIADAQTGGGYMGNQPAQLYEVYKNSVLILVPARRFDTWLIGLDKRPQRLLSLWIRKFAERVLEDKNQDCRQSWQRCCRSMLDLYASNTENPGKHVYLGAVAATAASLDDIDMFKAAVQCVKPAFDLADYQLMGEALNSRNIDVFWNSVVQMLIENGVIHTTLRRLIAFDNGLAHTGMTGNWDVKPWQSKLTTLASQSIASVVHIFPQDLGALVDLIESREDRPEDQFMLSEDVRNLLINKLQQGHFITTFAGAVFKRSNLSSESTTQVFRLIQAILPSLVADFALDAFVTSISANQEKGKGGKNYGVFRYVWTCKPQTLGSTRRFFNYVRQQDKQLLIMLFDRIRTQTGMIDMKMLRNWLFTLINAMVDHADIAIQPLRLCIAQLLDIYVAERCESEPEYPSDWSRADEVSLFPGDDPVEVEINTFLKDKDAEILESKYDLGGMSQLYSYGYLRFEADSTGAITIARKTCNNWAYQYKRWQEGVLQAKKGLAINCGPLARLQQIVPGYNISTSIPLRRRFLEDEDWQAAEIAM